VQYRTLGRTGIKVSPYALGAMMFGQAAGAGNPDHDDAIRIIHRALDAGINVVDTADVYSYGESEEVVGKALKDRRDGVSHPDAPLRDYQTFEWLLTHVAFSPASHCGRVELANRRIFSTGLSKVVRRSTHSLKA